MATVGAWNFDEGTGTTAADSSGNGNTLTGIPGWSASGHTNACMELAGEAGPNLAATGLTGAYTLMAWVNYDAFTGWSSIFEGSGVYVETNSTGDFDVWNGSAGGFAMATLTAGTWHHVAYAQDATGGNVYVDGSEVATLTVGSVPTTLDIGGSSGGPTDGRIDDVRVLDHKASAAEIATLMGEAVGSGGAQNIGTGLTAEADSSQALGSRKSRLVGRAGSRGLVG